MELCNYWNGDERCQFYAGHTGPHSYAKVGTSPPVTVRPITTGQVVDDLTVRRLVQLSYTTAKEKGWHDEGKEKTFTEEMMLAVTELAEVVEEFRNGKPINEIYYSGSGKPEGIPIEIADCIIRLADTCGKHNINLEEALLCKMGYNNSRPYRHGDKVV